MLGARELAVLEMEDEMKLRRLRRNGRGAKSRWWGEYRGVVASDAFELGPVV